MKHKFTRELFDKQVKAFDDKGKKAYGLYFQYDAKYLYDSRGCILCY